MQKQEIEVNKFKIRGNMSNFDYKEVKVVAKKSPITKTFKVISSIAAGVVGTIGSIVVLATSVVSGIGYYNHDNIINEIQNVGTKINNGLDNTINVVTNQFNNWLNMVVDGKTEISQDEIPNIVQQINNEFINQIGISLPADVISSITKSLNALVVGSQISVSKITDNINEYLKRGTKEIEEHVTNIFEQIVISIYGDVVQNPDGTIDYSKLYIWKIVFISTISVAAVLVLAGLLYVICLGVDKMIKRNHVKEAKEAIKKF